MINEIAKLKGLLDPRFVLSLIADAYKEAGDEKYGAAYEKLANSNAFPNRTGDVWRWYIYGFSRRSKDYKLGDINNEYLTLFPLNCAQQYICCVDLITAFEEAALLLTLTPEEVYTYACTHNEIWYKQWEEEKELAARFKVSRNAARAIYVVRSHWGIIDKEAATMIILQHYHTEGDIDFDPIINAIANPNMEDAQQLLASEQANPE